MELKAPLNKETIDAIIDLAGGETSILIELFDSFLQDGEELTSNIKIALESSDAEKLQYEVHTLKGLCGTIGAITLFEVCKELDAELKMGEQARINELVEELMERYQDLVVYINKNYEI